MCEHLAGVADELNQQLVLKWCQVQVLPRARYLPTREVHFDVTQHEFRRVWLGVTTRGVAQGDAHAGHLAQTRKIFSLARVFRSSSA